MGLLWLVALIAMEVWSIIQVVHQVGGLATLVLLAAGIIFGLQLLRAQGIGAMIKSAQTAQAGESPLGPLAEGIVKALAGILFIIPGFIGDIVGLILLLPFVRKAFARHLSKKAQFQTSFGAGGFGGAFGGGFGSGGFGMGGFGRSAANDANTQGNVYDHEGSAKPANRVIEGEVIEHKPEK